VFLLWWIHELVDVCDRVLYRHVLAGLVGYSSLVYQQKKVHRPWRRDPDGEPTPASGLQLTSISLHLLQAVSHRCLTWRLPVRRKDKQTDRKAEMNDQRAWLGTKP
jgi:hypothetical protein